MSFHKLVFLPKPVEFVFFSFDFVFCTMLIFNTLDLNFFSTLFLLLKDKKPAQFIKQFFTQAPILLKIRMKCIIESKSLPENYFSDCAKDICERLVA